MGAGHIHIQERLESGGPEKMQHPRSSECFYIELDREAGLLHTVRQGDGLLHIDTQGGRTVYVVGGTQAGNIQMEPGRELRWTFSAHTISTHTENPLEGFAIFLSLMGPGGLCPFSKGVRFWRP